MPRKHYEWKLRDKTLQLGERTLVMGILNVTPDSFSDGGKYADPDRAFARALELEEEGADIIDIGAESTRPGSARVSEAEELRRLVPVLKRLQGRLTIPISVDTYKSGVAAKALDLGADIINDPTGLTWDPELAKAVVQVNGGLIINHMRGTPETWAKLPPLKDPLATIVMELDSAMHRAVRAGVERKCIMVDPGLGFGKRKEQNAEILARLGEMGALDLPLLVGASRKHFLSKETEVETEFASAAAVAAAILYGAHIVRVHDLKAMKSVVQVTDEIARAKSEHEELERARAAAKKEEARTSGPRSGVGPREARPANSRSDNSRQDFSTKDFGQRDARKSDMRQPTTFRYDDRRDTRVAPSFGSDDPSEMRKPLRPPSGRAVPRLTKPVAVPVLSEELAEELKKVPLPMPGMTAPTDTAIHDLSDIDGEVHTGEITEDSADDDLDLEEELEQELDLDDEEDRAEEADGETFHSDEAARPAAAKKSAPQRAAKPEFAKPRAFKPASSRPVFTKKPAFSKPPYKGPRDASPSDSGPYDSESRPKSFRPGGSRPPASGSRPAFGSRNDDRRGDRERPAGPPRSSKPFDRDRPSDSRSSDNKPSYKKPSYDKPSYGGKPSSGARPAFGAKTSGGGRPSAGGRPSGEGRPAGGRPPSGKPSFGKPSFGKSGGRGAFNGPPDRRGPSERGSERSGSDRERPSGPPRSSGGKSFGSRPSSGGPFRGRPSGGKPPGGRPSSGGRPTGGRPSGGRPTGRRTPGRG
jgi:dihydropteroate synthase